MAETKKMDFFERYLTVWVLICIAAGIGIGSVAGEEIQFVADIELYYVNIPVAVLIWMMIYPMMVQVDFSSLKNIGKNSGGVTLTVIVNWLIKPFTMAFFAWLFFDNIYAAWLEPERADEFIAGAIILGAAPCTAMVFVWSYLSSGDANYTLVQVSVNDIILLFAFVPLVTLLLGITDFEIPYGVLITSVVAFVLLPLVAGYITNRAIIKSKGENWLKERFLPKLKPLSITALLLTLILLFAFQGDQILQHPLEIVMIAIPLIIQTYVIFGITWYSGKIFKFPYRICAPSAMIGASNFFELAVAVSIALFGLNSGASLATVVGVLIEVPIMLSLVRFANKNKY